MPSLSAQRDAALLILQTYVLPDIPPTISTETLGQILDATRRATIWEADTEYFYGDVILPTVRNGHAYQCTQHGTSGATEPVWPTGNGSTITDGESDPLLRFQEYGPDWANVYDTRRAIHNAAVYKMNQAAALRANGSEQMQQVYEHWKEISEKFSSIEVA